MQMANDLGKDPRNGRELAGPVRPFMGPGDPSRLMRLPFRGHAIAESSRQVSHDRASGAKNRKSVALCKVVGRLSDRASRQSTELAEGQKSAEGWHFSSRHPPPRAR